MVINRLKTAIICSIVFVSSASSIQSQTLTLLVTTPSTVDNILNLGVAAAPGFVSGTAFTTSFSGYSADIGFTGASGVVNGTNISWAVGGISGSAWAPTIGGSIYTGNYFVAAKGTIMLTLSTSITNFQFLWGSPSFGDTVTLFDGANQVAQFNGGLVNAANPTFTNARGTTVITNISTSNGVTFDRVALSNPTSNFEFALQTSLATAPTSNGTNTGTGVGGAVTAEVLPLGAPFPMLGATLLGNFAALAGMFAMWKRRIRNTFLLSAKLTLKLNPNM